MISHVIALFVHGCDTLALLFSLSCPQLHLVFHLCCCFLKFSSLAACNVVKLCHAHLSGFVAMTLNAYAVAL